MSRRATLRLLLLGLLLCWCGVFLRSENTEKSIVRALLLEQTPEQWNVALLYQFPEAAADSSDATASVQLCAGTGKTLEQALFAAEEHLPQRPSYRLCEYLFLNTGSLRGELSACEPLWPGQKRKSVSRSSCSNAPRIRQSVHHTCMSGGKDCCSRWYS